MTVYVAQRQKWHVDGVLRDKFDFTTAMPYGNLKFLLSSRRRPNDDLQDTLRELREGLEDFDPARDWFVLSGNPVLLGLCIKVLSDIDPSHVPLLQWSNKDRHYYPVVIENVDG